MKYVLTGGIGALLAYLLWPLQSTRPTSQPLPNTEVASQTSETVSMKALELPNASMQVEQLIEILCRWVLQDGDAALAWAEANLDADQQKAVLHDVLATWTWHDPEALIAWFRSGYVPDKFRHARVNLGWPQRESIGELITQWLALRDPVRAARFIVEEIYQFKTNISASGTGTALVANLVTPQEHLQVCQALLPFYERHQRHLGETHQVLLSWREIDPLAAGAFLEQYPEAGPTRDDLAAQRVYASSPQSKANVADQQLAEAPPEKRATVMQTIVSAWAMQDPNGASQWLANQGPTPETLRAHASLAEQLAEHKPHAGIGHATSLPEGLLLESTLESIITKWATRSLDETLSYLETNPENWPADRQERLYQLAITTPAPSL